MSHAMKSVGDVGMSRDERSMLLGTGDEGADGGPVQQLLGVLSTMRETAQSVVDGRANRLWADECMNHLILGVEVSLGQGWNDLVDSFTDAGRILQSYENGGKAGQAAPYLVEAYDILCALVSDAMSGTSQPALTAQWRTRYQKEVAALEMAGFELVTDDYDGAAEEADDAFAFPDISNSAKIRPQDDLPTLDELPPLDSMLSSAAPAKAQPSAQKPRVDATPPAARIDAERVARVEEARQQKAAAESAVARAKPVEEEIPVGVQPSTIVVELVDRICEELGGLSRRQMDDRALAVEMIQGGITALKREAGKCRHTVSAELCEEMLKACTFLAQGHAEIDERFTDLGFAFCGVYVEAMTNPTSENVSEWRAESANLIEEWLEAATRPDAPAPKAAPAPEAPVAKAVSEPTSTASSPIAAPVIQPAPVIEPAPISAAPAPIVSTLSTESTSSIITTEEETEDAAAESEPVWVGSAAVAQPVEMLESPAPVNAAMPAPILPATPRTSLPSADLFLRAQEALARGDGEAAKALALQAAAMIAEAEVEKADSMLRGAEAKLKANVTAIEEARSEVKNTEKSVMNSASEVAAGETILGQVKSQTAKVSHELQDSEAEVADIERQIAEFQARLAAQQAEVANVKAKLEEAKVIEQQSETQLNALRDRERDTRKELEAARQRVKDRQRVSAEIQGEMERAREQLSRQRTSLADIRQTLNRPEPIKTPGSTAEPDAMLF